MRKTAVLLFLLCTFLPAFLVAQDSSPDSVFTVTVAPPTPPAAMQARYFVTGEFGGYGSSTAAQGTDNKIRINTASQGKSARTFKAILYAPGCQLVTISADDLAAGMREGEFRCQKLSTVQLHGRADVSHFGGRKLQVEMLYVCSWAGRFFGVGDLAISPISLARVPMETDGSFTAEVPDFISDPSWASLSNDAGLMLFLIDAKSGTRLARMSGPADLSNGGTLRVAASYQGEIQFSLRRDGASKSANLKR